METKTIHSNNISLVEVLAALRWLPPARLPGSVWIYADGTHWMQPPSIPGMSAPTRCQVHPQDAASFRS